MNESQQFTLGALTLGLLALAHAAVSWPLTTTVAFFGGGALIAFAAEAFAIGRGWLEHHVGPTVIGVPVYVLFGWIAVIYGAVMVALFVTGGWLAVIFAGCLATGYDLLTDHQGVERGLWSYTGGPAGPRFRGVPWWNYAGWFLISTPPAGIAVLVG